MVLLRYQETTVKTGETHQSQRLAQEPVVVVAEITRGTRIVVDRAGVAVVRQPVDRAPRGRGSMEGILVMEATIRPAEAAARVDPVRAMWQGALAGQALRPL